MNPLLSDSALPKYDEIKPEHVAEAVEKMAEAVEAGLAAIESDSRPPSWAAVIEELNTLEDWFTKIWSPVSHLNVVRNEPALRDAYQAAQPKIVSLGLKIAQSPALYAKLVSIRDGAEWQKLDEGQKRSIPDRQPEPDAHARTALGGRFTQHVPRPAKRMDEPRLAGSLELLT